MGSIRAQFLDLFRRAFGRPYPVELWDHYYKDNPCGAARAVALWDRDCLVGFTALLMQELVDRETGTLIPFGYNVTAMIDPEHRGGAIAYLTMMERIKELGRRAGLRFLLGFPSSSNLLPMTRLASFTLVDTARFVRSRAGLGRYAEFLARELKKPFLSNRACQWRLSRFPYQINQGCVTKTFQGELNILDWLELQEREEIRGIFPFWFSAGACPETFEQVDDQTIRLCCYRLDSGFDPHTIKKSLLYSDVY